MVQRATSAIIYQQAIKKHIHIYIITLEKAQPLQDIRKSQNKVLQNGHTCYGTENRYIIVLKHVQTCMGIQYISIKKYTEFVQF